MKKRRVLLMNSPHWNKAIIDAVRGEKKIDLRVQQVQSKRIIKKAGEIKPKAIGLEISEKELKRGLRATNIKKGRREIEKIINEGEKLEEIINYTVKKPIRHDLKLLISPKYRTQRVLINYPGLIAAEKEGIQFFALEDKKLRDKYKRLQKKWYKLESKGKTIEALKIREKMNEINNQREEFMVKKIEEKLKKEGGDIIITIGNAHYHGIEKRLKKKNIEVKDAW